MLSNSPFPQLENLPPVHASTTPSDAVADMRVHCESERRAMGYDAGYREGLALGRSDAVGDVGGLAQALEEAARDFRQRETVDVETVSREAVELALIIAEAIVGREVAESSQPGRDGLVRALGFAPSSGELVAHLNPSDLQSVGDISNLAGSREVTLVADPTVASGGCILHAGKTRIDAQIADALERVRAELLGPAVPSVAMPSLDMPAGGAQ